MSSNKRRGWLNPDLAQIVTRFPVPLAISIAFAVIANLEIAGVIHLPRFRWELPDLQSVSLNQVYGALVSGFLASGAAHLFAEGRRWGRIPGILLACGCAVVVALICWNLRALDVQFLFLFPALILAVTVASTLRRGASENTLWMFNARLALAILSAIIAGVIFGAGLSAIVESLNYLFGADIDSDAHEYIWMTAATLIAPIAGLSMVSTDLDEDFQPEGANALLVKGVSRILNYLLIPIALVYVVILHFYAAKMLIEWELPRGQVGIMVLIFALGGAAVWLIASPWRRSGSAMVRLFERGWFWFLIVPLVLLGIGLWRRVSDYGVTPDRYGLAAVGLWVLFVMVIGAIVARSAVPRLMLASLAVVLFLSSFGPWGARSISADSQYDRLTELMAAQGYFQDGRLEVPAEIDPIASDAGASIVRYLWLYGHLERLAPMFSETQDDPFSRNAAVTSEQINGMLGFATRSRQAAVDRDATSVKFSQDGPITLDLPANSVFSGPHRIGDEADWIDDGAPHILLSSDRISILFGPHSWDIDTEDVLTAAREASQGGGTGQPLVFAVDGAGGQAQLVLLQISGRLTEERPVVFSGSANLVLPASAAATGQ